MIAVHFLQETIGHPRIIKAALVMLLTIHGRLYDDLMTLAHTPIQRAQSINE